MLAVTPEGQPTRTGIVADPGLTYAGAKSGIYATPAPEVFVVVLRGDTYRIDAFRPSTWELMRGRPVVEVIPVPQEGLLVFASPWRVWALDADGIRWRSRRVAVDGIVIDEVAGGELLGTADPLDGPEAAPFRIDLTNGTPTGCHQVPE